MPNGTKALKKSQAHVVLEVMRQLKQINATFVELKIGDDATFTRYSGDGGFGVSRAGRSVGEYDTLQDFAAAHGLSV